MPLRVRSARRFVGSVTQEHRIGDLYLTRHPIAPEGCCPWGPPESEVARWRAALLESIRGYYRVNRGWFAELLAREQVTLTCSVCLAPERCVRLVLAQVLVRLGAVYEGEGGA